MTVMLKSILNVGPVNISRFFGIAVVHSTLHTFRNLVSTQYQPIKVRWCIHVSVKYVIIGSDNDGVTCSGQAII